MLWTAAGSPNGRGARLGDDGGVELSALEFLIDEAREDLERGPGW